MTEKRSEKVSIPIIPKEGNTMIRNIDIEIAKMSSTLKSMIDLTAKSEESVPVNLEKISVTILDKIIEYLVYHIDDPIEEKDSDDEDYNDTKRSDDISEWDRKFMSDIEKNREMLFDLIEAANFLHIKGLLDLGCKTAANQIKGKSAEEVRQLWNIKCDLTPEEIQKIKEENAWAEDN